MEVNRLKITYQRNMIAGQCVAVVIFACLAVVVLLMGGADDGRGRSPGLPSGKILEFGLPAGEPLLIPPVKGRPPDQLPFFTPIKIIPDHISREFSPTDITVAAQLPHMDHLPDIGEDVLPALSTDGGGGVAYAPASYEDVRFPGERSSLSFDQEAKLLFDVEPEYPLLAANERKEGVVKVLVMVDETGELKPFPVRRADGTDTVCTVLVVRERPAGWFFSEEVRKVLPQWKFLPRIENGNPVACFMEITYHFCLGIGCTRLEIRLRSTNEN